MAKKTESKKDMIEKIFIEDEMKQSYLDYAMSVIVSRALPDIRDGLKPIQRRLLFSMKRNGITFDKAFVKAAKIVGDTLGNYHPHGDTSTYTALVRLTQRWSINEPLVVGHGNWGSIWGDQAAAMRYTECKLSEYTDEVFFKEMESFDINNDLSKNIIWQNNYDDSTNEPVVLNTTYPTVLVHGANGVAVGMACNIPQHNLKEVIDLTLALIKTPYLKDARLLSLIKGPDVSDTSVGGFFLSSDKIKDGLIKGRSPGGFALCANFHFEHTSHGKTAIILDSIPYGLNVTSMVTGIINAVALEKEKFKLGKGGSPIKNIVDLREESDRHGVRYVIEVKRGEDPAPVVRELMLKGKITNTLSYNCNLLEDNVPSIKSLREIILKWYAYRNTNLQKYFIINRRIAEKRLHDLEGFIKVLPHIKKCLDTILNAKNETDAIQKLMTSFDLSRIQARYILSANLKRLVNRGDTISKEVGRLKQIISYNANLAMDDKAREDYICKELRYIRDKYNKPRNLLTVEERNAKIFTDNKGRGKILEKVGILKPIDSAISMAIWEFNKK
jgi:DNA gyrase subunit A